MFAREMAMFQHEEKQIDHLDKFHSDGRASFDRDKTGDVTKNSSSSKCQR